MSSVPRSKKRKAAPAEPPAAAARPPPAARAAAPPPPAEQVIDLETQKYFQEVAAELGRLGEAGAEQPPDEEEPADPSEQRALLLSSALREAGGQEAALSLDPVTSRLLEQLLRGAATEQLAAFAAGLAERAEEVLCSPFGSHVAETLFEALRAAGGAGEEGPLAQLCAQLAPAAARLAPHACASPALRSLLGCLSGVDVRAAAERPRDAPQAPAPASASASAARAPRLLRSFAAGALDSLEGLGEGYWGVTASPAGSALLQALALSHGPFPADLGRLLPRLLGARLAGAAGGDALELGPGSDLKQLLRCPAGSRLAEAALRLAAPPLRQRLAQRCLAPSDLPDLARHGAANFALQAYLRAMGPEEAEAAAAAVAALAPLAAELLASRRGGVVAAMLAAAAGAGPDVARAAARGVASGLRGPAGAAEQSYVATLAPALLRGVSGGASRNGFSLHGCACLAQLLALPSGAGRAFSDSLAALPAEEAEGAACDPAASRCLEPLLRGGGEGAEEKVRAGLRRKLAAALAPAWPRLAAHPVGRHVLAAAWAGAAGQVKEQEALLRALLPAARALGGARGCAGLAAQLSEYAREPEAWRRRAGARARVQEEFADILSGPAAPAAGRKERGARPRAQHAKGNSIAELSAGIQKALAAMPRG